MIKRFFALLVVLLAGFVTAIPASADAATSVTQNFHGTFKPMTVGPLCGAPGGVLTGTGNAVMHMTVNAAGDAWGTATQEESFTLTPTDKSLPIFTGHFAIWFGFSSNLNNVVSHDIFNVIATGSDGSSIALHLVDHFSISASLNVNSFSIGCGS